MKMKNPRYDIFHLRLRSHYLFRLAREREEEAGCEAISPEHRELVTWVHRGWSSVKTEMERGDQLCDIYVF